MTDHDVVSDANLHCNPSDPETLSAAIANQTVTSLASVVCATESCGRIYSSFAGVLDVGQS